MTAALELVTDGTADELPEWLTSADIMFEAGMTYRQLDYAVRAGYLQPGRQWQGAKRGSGSPRVWPKDELGIAQRMGRLTRAGIPAALAAAIARSGDARHEIAPGVWIEVAA